MKNIVLLISKNDFLKSLIYEKCPFLITYHSKNLI